VVGGVAHTVDLDDARAGEPAAAPQQIDAVIGQPALLSSIGVVRDHEVTPGERRLDIDLGARGRLARPMDGLARSQQRLGRDARPVGALAPDQLPLDDRNPHAGLGKRAGAVLARRPAAQHDDVVVVAHGVLRCLVVEGPASRLGTLVAPVVCLADALALTM
jgi:hypothetical protein